MDNTPEIMNVLMTYVGALSALRTNVPAYSAPVIPLKAVLGSVHTWCPGTVPGFYSTPGTNVNTPFFLVPTPEFGHGAGARVQGLDLVLGH